MTPNARFGRHSAEAPRSIPAWQALRHQCRHSAFWRRYAVGLLPAVALIAVCFVAIPSFAPAVAAGACAFVGAWAVEVARGEQRREDLAAESSVPVPEDVSESHID